ncbi:MAG: hypothetical protein IM628_06950 [Phenylobacterium sp.]|uniref:hypothetical protein n=1 Tax=Phenylobacterium sp. TaxID=1871053 RepID=UPI0026011706|nr:hypothetical protein [Phenylobacterium sp.]MCA6304541.1 hypothetical protein [Phenylobacterium sp.]
MTGIVPTEAPFLVVDLDLYAPGGTPGAPLLSWMEGAWMEITRVPFTGEAVESVRASDVGYVSRAADAGGVQAWPATLSLALEIDRRADLAVNGTGAGASWGAIRLIDDGRYSGLAATRNTDARTARVRLGRKTWDADRMLHVDPALATLTDVQVGVARNWQFEEQAVVVPLRDPSYWLERPLQATVYAGTGQMEGTASLAGRPKPKARGGTTAAPIREIAPVLIDPATNTYQYSDGPGTVVQVYEGGRAVFTAGADTTNLWAGSTAAGTYRTDNADGLFQLGAAPVGDITADVTGAFPIAGTVTVASEIARHLMTEDLGLPAGLVDTAAFSTIASSVAWTAGAYWDGSSPTDGAEAVGHLLASIGARLLPTRGGLLRPVLIRAPSGTAVASYDTGRILAVRILPPPVDPPARRVRVGWRRIHTPRTGGLSAAITAARRQELAEPFRFETVTSAAVAAAFRRPTDPAPIETALTVQADATALATAMGTLWSAKRLLLAVDLPILTALAREVGDLVRIDWPLGDLAGGKTGLVVGDRLSWTDQTGTLYVLV